MIEAGIPGVAQGSASPLSLHNRSFDVIVRDRSSGVCRNTKKQRERSRSEDAFLIYVYCVNALPVSRTAAKNHHSGVTC